VDVAVRLSKEESIRFGKGQLTDMLEGRAPEDFRCGWKLAVKQKFKGYLGGKSISSGGGKKAVGFDLREKFA
jgi:hypothetical protein